MSNRRCASSTILEGGVVCFSAHDSSGLRLIRDGPNEMRAVEAQAMTNTEMLLDRLRAALRSEPRIGRDFRPARLEIDADGTLMIEGEVSSVAAKKLALERCGAFSEVSGLLDRLRVAPAAPMQDAEIRAHLRQALSQEPSFAALEIAERRGQKLDDVRGVPR